MYNNFKGRIFYKNGENGMVVKNPTKLKDGIKLYDFQRKELYHILDCVMNNVLYKFVDQYNGNESKFISNVKVYCNKVGSGKSFISALYSVLDINVRNRNKFKKYEMKQIELNNKIISVIDNRNYNEISLVIIPQHLKEQWIDNYNKFNDVKIFCIDTMEQVNKFRNFRNIIYEEDNDVIEYDNLDELIKKKKFIEINENYYEITQSNVVLLTDKMWDLCSDIINGEDGLHFKNLIIDEVDTIQYPKNDCYSIDLANFLLFITGTPEGIEKVNHSFMNIHKDNIDFMKILSFKSDENWIDEVLELDKPIILNYNCYTPKTLNIVNTLIPKNIMEMLNAGNIENAIKLLGCDVSTTENLAIQLTKKIDEAIIQRENYLLHNDDNNVKKELIILYKKKCIIERRINENLNDNCCVICLDNIENPSILKCCNKIYCTVCIALSLGSTNRCPNCKSSINVKEDLCVINNVIKKNKIEKILTKLEHLIIILNETIKMNECTLIFANYEETIENICNALDNNNIQYESLAKSNINIETMNKIIDNYKNGDNKILLINARYYCAGLNLTMTDNIIHFHVMVNSNIEEQINGRVIRIGRTKKTPVKIHYLLHDGEKNYYDNNIINTNYIDWLLNNDFKQINNNNNLINTNIEINTENIYDINFGNYETYYDTEEEDEEDFESDEEQLTIDTEEN